ncbi:MAG: ATP-binding protein [Chloroflexi bacterium]|nr:ATP-binding protein [Chloroflexota bacterium]
MISDCMSEARDLNRAWQAALGQLQVELQPHNYNTWLKGTRPLGFEGETVIVESTVALGLEWLNERLAFVVQRALSYAMDRDLRVRFVPRGTGGVSSESAPGGPDEPPARPRPRTVAGNLNCAYTFDRYVEAEGNRLAFRSCAGLLAGDEHHFNPIVVFGPPGMGKTHLLHAMACGAADAGWAVACFSAEEFTNRFMGAVRRSEVETFQACVRSVRLLVIDDLQYVATRKGTQDELVHTIDAVTNSGGYVAVGSERHPMDLDLPQRLATRLTGGLVAEVAPFQRAERRAFIERLCNERRAAFPAWVVERIAALEAPSVRLLQGAVNVALHLGRCELLDVARLDAELVRIAVSEGRSTPSLAGVLESVARHFGTTGAELVGRSRTAAVTQARSVAAAALRARGCSLAETAAALGGRDRSTVKQLADRGAALAATEPRLQALLAAG